MLLNCDPILDGTSIGESSPRGHVQNIHGWAPDMTTRIFTSLLFQNNVAKMKYHGISRIFEKYFFQEHVSKHLYRIFFF